MRCDELQLEVQGFQNKELTSNQLLLMVLAFALFHGKLNSKLGTDLWILIELGNEMKNFRSKSQASHKDQGNSLGV